MSGRSHTLLLAVLSIGCWAVASSAWAQSSPRAEANQLHSAIVNGDVESLRYWLTDRHADASAASAAEPDITPLERCVGLAARTLGGPPAGAREPGGGALPAVNLRTLQAMVTLLYQHGARLTDADRQRFAGPALRWYDDTVSPPPAPAATQTAPVSPPATGGSSKPAFTIGVATVAVTTDPRESCNGAGHAVYLVNRTQLSVSANVTRHEGATATTDDRQQNESYTLDPDSSWRLGCDTAADGGRVRYELKNWR